ncbi:MAG: uracil-DNA glycosylase [Firmicutes bacterium]|nr:uracil-DNA glycosylase [Bacillota bacterium]
MHEKHLPDFLKHLQEYKAAPDVFNPWKNHDKIYDVGINAPAIRQRQLWDYLACRISRAKYILCAEAVGYQGAKFSGVPLTSERILLGRSIEVAVSDILPTAKPVRTSNPEAASAKTVQQYGYAEPTATIAWGLLKELPLSPFEVIFWNIFPFHPFHKDKGRLSNRTPRTEETGQGRKYLEHLVSLCPPGVKVIAIGEKAAEAIGDCPKVRHPANGGAGMFREQLPRIIL